MKTAIAISLVCLLVVTACSSEVPQQDEIAPHLCGKSFSIEFLMPADEASYALLEEFPVKVRAAGDRPLKRVEIYAVADLMMMPLFLDYAVFRYEGNKRTAEEGTMMRVPGNANFKFVRIIALAIDEDGRRTSNFVTVRITGEFKKN